MLDGEMDAFIVDSDDAVWTLHCRDTELKMPALHQNGENNGYIINEDKSYIYIV